MTREKPDWVRARTTVQGGFSYVELMIGLMLLVILAGIVAMSTGSTITRTQLSAEMSVLLADLKQMQLKSMAGEVFDPGYPPTYGVLITENSYQLFQGASAGTGLDLGTFQLEGATLSASFDSDQIVFASGSGQITGFEPTQNQITVYKSSSAEQESVTLNSYGVVTARSHSN